jgi:hypothetical protein
MIFSEIFLSVEIFLEWKWTFGGMRQLTPALVDNTKQWSPPATIFITDVSLPRDVDDDVIHGPLATTGLLQLIVSPDPS